MASTERGRRALHAATYAKSSRSGGLSPAPRAGLRDCARTNRRTGRTLTSSQSIGFTIFSSSTRSSIGPGRPRRTSPPLMRFRSIRCTRRASYRSAAHPARGRCAPASRNAQAGGGGRTGARGNAVFILPQVRHDDAQRRLALGWVERKRNPSAHSSGTAVGGFRCAQPTLPLVDPERVRSLDFCIASGIQPPRRSARPGEGFVPNTISRRIR